jgi:hypothetical protein
MDKKKYAYKDRDFLKFHIRVIRLPILVSGLACFLLFFLSELQAEKFQASSSMHKNCIKEMNSHNN